MTTDTTPTQADREAARAAQTAMLIGGIQGDKDAWRRLEEAFMRHRLASHPIAAGDGEKLRAAREVAITKAKKEGAPDEDITVFHLAFQYLEEALATPPQPPADLVEEQGQ